MKIAIISATLLISAAAAQAAGTAANTAAETAIDTAAQALAGAKWNKSVFWSEKALSTPGLSTADTVRALTSLCVAQTKLNRFGEAWNSCNAAVTAGPAEWTGYINRGNLRVMTGDVPGARADYARAKALNPAHPIAQAAADMTLTARSPLTPSFVGLGSGGAAVQTASSKTATDEQ